MADLLVMAIDKSGIDRGDVIDVFSDNKLSEYASAGGKFIIVRCPEMTVEEARELLEAERELETVGYTRDGQEVKAYRVIKRRKRKIGLSKFKVKKNQIITGKSNLLKEIKVK